MFNSQNDDSKIEQRLDQLTMTMKPNTLDLERRIISEALESKPKLLKVHQSPSFSSRLALPIAACFALVAVMFWLPSSENSPDSTANVVVFDELEIQEMWLVQDQLLFDDLN